MWVTIKISTNTWYEKNLRIGDIISVTNKLANIDNCIMKIISRTFNPMEEPNLYTVELRSIPSSNNNPLPEPSSD